MAFRIGDPSRSCSEMWRSHFQVVWAQAKDLLGRLQCLGYEAMPGHGWGFPLVLPSSGCLVITVMGRVFTWRTTGVLCFFWTAVWRCLGSTDLIVCLGAWILLLCIKSIVQDFRDKLDIVLCHTGAGWTGGLSRAPSIVQSCTNIRRFVC